MNDRYHTLLNHDKWNRRLMNVYWSCNAIILVVELVLMLVHFSRLEPRFTVGEYFFNFVFLPSSLIFGITAFGEIAVRLLKNRHAAILPYVIAFVCVALCAVLRMVHYNVSGIYAIYAMPIFFSLVYSNRRVLLVTFLSSMIVLILFNFWYFGGSALLIRSDDLLLYDLADVLTNIAIMLAAYFVGTVILSRFGEIIDTLLEAERSAARAEAEAESRSMFLANMSHEIRTPMNGVIGFTELALDAPQLPAETKICLDNIKMSAEGLLGIIDGILDLSKIEAGKMELEHVPFRLGDVLRQCRIISASGAAEKALELRFRTTPVAGTLLGDPTRLQQAVLNLLSNAVKFTDKGTVELIVTAHEDNGWLEARFEVRDSGIGMTEEQLQRIFNPFVQADESTTRKYGGTGLGLSITRNIVELMGGRLQAESEPGFGSRFFFDLRFEIAQQSESAAVQTQVAAEQIGTALFQGNILICEDNDMNQQVISMHLSKFGLAPVIVNNGARGLEVFKEYADVGQPFDLVFMDIHMPVMDGLEAAKKLLESGCTAPIIALTANAMPQDRSEYIESGMSGCLIKPFVAAELYACLRQYLEPVGTRPLPDLEFTVDMRAASDTADAIDRIAGLESCAGSEQLYQKLREDFLEQGRMWNITLMDAIVAGETVSAHRAAHTLSGRAAILGALRLSQAAREMEYALSRDNGMAGADCNPQTEDAPELETLAANLGREMAAVLRELAMDRKVEAHSI